MGKFVIVYACVLLWIDWFDSLQIFMEKLAIIIPPKMTKQKRKENREAHDKCFFLKVILAYKRVLSDYEYLFLHTMF